MVLNFTIMFWELYDHVLLLSVLSQLLITSKEGGRGGEMAQMLTGKVCQKIRKSPVDVPLTYL